MTLLVRNMLFMNQLSDCTSQGGQSALMLAASAGHTEVVAQLLEAGANTDLQDKVSCCQVTLA